MSLPVPPDDPVKERALHWFVRSRADDFAAEERAQLEQWLGEAPSHRIEYGRLGQTWGQLGGLHNYFSRPQPKRHSSSWKTVSLAASVAGVAGLLAVLYWPETYQALPGEHLSVQLVEGIKIELDADSVIRVSRTSSHPDVRLIQGSAYFDVQAKHSGLEVHVADATLRDIGTRFAATVVQGNGSLSVAEGMVEISASAGKKMLSEGQQTRFTSLSIDNPVAINPQQVAAWKSGEYRFEASTLDEVADAIWRHSRVRVEIPDRRIAKLSISGNFDIRQPDKLLWAIAQIHNLQLKQQAEGRWMLSHL